MYAFAAVVCPGPSTTDLDQAPMRAQQNGRPPTVQLKLGQIASVAQLRETTMESEREKAIQDFLAVGSEDLDSIQAIMVQMPVHEELAVAQMFVARVVEICQFGV